MQKRARRTLRFLRCRRRFSLARALGSTARRRAVPREGERSAPRLRAPSAPARLESQGRTCRPRLSLPRPLHAVSVPRVDVSAARAGSAEFASRSGTRMSRGFRGRPFPATNLRTERLSDAWGPGYRPQSGLFSHVLGAGEIVSLSPRPQQNQSARELGGVGTCGGVHRTSRR